MVATFPKWYFPTHPPPQSNAVLFTAASYLFLLQQCKGKTFNDGCRG